MLSLLRRFGLGVGSGHRRPRGPRVRDPRAEPLESRELLAGIVVTPTAGLQTSEDGGAAVVSVYLTSAPSSNVAIAFASTNPLLGTPSPNVLVFTPSNFHRPQVVRITGQMDDLVTSNTSYQVVGAVVTRAPGFVGLGVPTLNIRSLHPRGLAPGIAVSPTSGLQTTKSGGVAHFTVRLTEKPRFPVAVPIATSNNKEGVPAPPVLVFTPQNWSVPQAVTVTGQDDGTLVDTTYQVRVGPAQSFDAVYRGKQGANVTLVNKDDTGVARFSGAYTGTYSGTGSFMGFVAPVNGSVQFTVLNGVIAVNVPGMGAGTLTPNGDGTFHVNGGLPGATFSGVFVVTPTGAREAHGSWSYQAGGAVGQGGWVATAPPPP
jgi:hypothetical protein